MVRIRRFVPVDISILLLALMTLFTRAYGQARIDCSAFQSRSLNHSVHYCVLLPPGYAADAKPTKRYAVLYFLHGLGENEQTLFNTGGWNLIEDLRQQQKIGDFLIVAPDGGRTFYINSADHKVLYSDFFLQEFMPYIESKYHVRPGRESRAITGVSMGGYGALRLAFAHPELFSSVSAESAALMTDSPHDLNEAMRSGSQLGRVLAPVFGQPIDVPHWEANSPFALAKTHAAALRKLGIYFNCGQDDDFGFEKGAEVLHRQLASASVKHEYHLYPGDHSLSYFMAHIGEALQFHSRAFDSAK